MATSVGSLDPAAVFDAVEVLLDARPGWMRYGECCGIDPDAFFPPKWDKQRMDAAKAVCAKCVVREPCLEYALGRRDDGVWGGTSARERRLLRLAAKAGAA